MIAVQHTGWCFYAFSVSVYVESKFQEINFYKQEDREHSNLTL